MAPLPRFAPPLSSWADDVDEEENVQQAGFPAGPSSHDAAPFTEEQLVSEEQVAAEAVAAELDAAEMDAAAMEADAAGTEGPVEWVEVKQRRSRGKK